MPEAVKTAWQQPFHVLLEAPRSADSPVYSNLP
jgi:hypothetical protein